MKKIILLLFLSFFSQMQVWASTHPYIRTDYCPGGFCGVGLVGSVLLMPNVIQWIGPQQPPNMTVDILGEGAAAFGLTGKINYLSTGAKPNAWSWSAPISGGINLPFPNGGAPSIGLFFSPHRGGDISTEITQDTTLTGVNSRNSLIGRGIVDDPVSPAFTLSEISINGNTQRDNTTLYIAPGATVSIGVKAQIDSARLMQIATANGLQPSDMFPVTHAYVDVLVIEEGTGCYSPSTKSFVVTNATPNNTNNLDQYAQYLYPGTEIGTPGDCHYSVSILRSVGKDITFYARNQNSTGNGRLRIMFALRGHLNMTNPNLNDYPGSVLIYDLKTKDSSPVVQPDQPPVANATAKFICEYNANQDTWRLNASGSVGNQNANIQSYQWNTNGTTFFDGQSLQTLDNPYAKVSLRVTDVNGNQGTETHSCPQTDIQYTFAENQHTFTASEGYQDYQWQVLNDPSAILYTPTSRQTAINFGTQNPMPNVQVTVTTQEGYQTIAYKTFTLEVELPTASFQPLSPTSGSAPLTVQFDASNSQAFGNDNELRNYYWYINNDLVNGMPIQNPDYTHEFTPGSYTVQLEVEDARGNRSTRSSSKSIEVFAPTVSEDIVPRFTLAKQQYTDRDIILDSESSLIPADIPVSYTWSISQEGNPTEMNYQLSPEDGVAPTAIVRFLETGNYQVTLTIISTDETSAQSESQTRTKKIQILQERSTPIARFTSSQDGLKVILNGAESADPDNLDGTGILYYQWQIEPLDPLFGEDKAQPMYDKLPGLNASQSTVQFYRAGRYQVSLVVIDDENIFSEPYTETITLDYPNPTQTWVFGSQSILLPRTPFVENPGQISLGIQNLATGDTMPTNLSVETKVNIAANIHAGEHGLNSANILVVMQYTESNGENSTWFYKTGAWPEWHAPWIVDFSNASMFLTDVTLADNTLIPIYRGQLPPGDYKIFAGYVLPLPDSTDFLVGFNGDNPLEFRVTE